MTAACDWTDPGLHRYTGSAETAIHAFAEIPRPVQDRLIAKFNARDIDDTLVIDRDEIRGVRNVYGPGIRSMHFGGRGQLCATVTRAGWPLDHVETALVFCDAETAWCVAWPSVCSNWFIAERRGELAPLVFGPVPYAAPAPPAGDLLQPLPGAVPVPVVPEAETDRLGEGTAPFVAFAPPSPIGRAVYLPAIPEPPTWLLLFGGMLLFVRRAKKRFRRFVDNINSEDFYV